MEWSTKYTAIIVIMIVFFAGITLTGYAFSKMDLVKVSVHMTIDGTSGAHVSTKD